MSTYLDNVLSFYLFNRFSLIDVPYIVDKDVSDITRPKDCYDLYHTNNKVYVASGEQSFIQLMKENKLKDGLSMCLTPCFRDEKNLDDLHLRMFLKLELIHYKKEWDDYSIFDDEKKHSLNYLIEATKKLYEGILKVKCNHSKIEVIQIDENQYDININDIEVGSYGIRESKYGNFIYGTGIALPRFDQAINKNLEI